MTTPLVPKTYIYKVYNSSGNYQGDLPNVTSDFAYKQDINSAGSQITITCGISADVSGLPIPTIDDETGAPIQDETGQNLLAEGYPDVVGSNATLINNGNKIKIYEFSSYHPNGQLVFQGQINRWQAKFGGNTADDTIDILVYSDGQDLNNYLVTGSPYITDQSQTQQDSFLGINDDTQKGFDNAQQSFITGSSVTKLDAVDVMLAASSSSYVGVTLYAEIFASLGDAANERHVLGTATAVVSSTNPTVTKFVFPNTITVAPNTQYVIQIEGKSYLSGQHFQGYIYYKNSNVYANGTFYSDYNQVNLPTGADAYFVTYYSGGATTSFFGAQDPTTGILESFMTNYAAQGGLISYNNMTIDPTGLSVGYTFVTNTVLDGINTVLNLAPHDFYWYLDVGSDTLYFKQTAATAKYTLVKGVDIAGLELSATIENIINKVYFSGGLVNGSNLFSAYSDATSIAKYGRRLDRKSDNRVTVQATADALGNSEVKEKKDEQHQTTVTLLDSQVDISQYRVGQTVGFAGFGNFIDFLILQIVRLEYTPNQVTLTLGKLPPRLNITVAQAQAELIALQTINNPSTPS